MYKKAKGNCKNRKRKGPPKAGFFALRCRSEPCQQERSLRIGCDRPDDLVVVVNDRFASVEQPSVQPEFFTVQATIRRHTCVEHPGIPPVTEGSGDRRRAPLADAVVVVAAVDRHRDDEFPHRCDRDVAVHFHAEPLAVHHGFVAVRLVVEHHLTQRSAIPVLQRVGHLLGEGAANAKQGENECDFSKELSHYQVLSGKLTGLLELLYYYIYYQFCQY